MRWIDRLNEIRDGFEPAFWVANVTELFERLAYYAAFSVLAVYFHENLRFSDRQAGDLVGYFSAVVWFLPILGGTLADWLGFRKSLSLAYLVLGIGYFLLGSLSASWMEPLRQSFPLSTVVLLILTVPAFGPAIVKPCVVGTTARASAANVRSIGYSIYYTIVNIGSTFGPLTALFVRRSWGITNVFRVSAACALLMFFATTLFYREPRGSLADRPRTSMVAALRNLVGVLSNFRFMLFLLIFSGYWVIFWQQFIALPLFLRGHVNPKSDVEFLLTVDPLAVILLQIAVSHATRKIRPFAAMTLGTLVTSASWIFFAVMNLSRQIDGSWRVGPWTISATGVPVWGIAALFVLAVGEMIQSPRYYEYVSRLAPLGQQGTYMGYAFLPIAIGSAIAGGIGGRLVGHFDQPGRQAQHMWWVISGIGFGTTLLMWLYNLILKPTSIEDSASNA